MNLKELIFGEGVHTGGSGGVYRDSVQAWLPIKNIIGGVVITKDNGSAACQHLSEVCH